MVPDGQRGSGYCHSWACEHTEREEFLAAPVVLDGQRGPRSMPLFAYGYTGPMPLLAWAELFGRFNLGAARRYFELGSIGCPITFYLLCW